MHDGSIGGAVAGARRRHEDRWMSVPSMTPPVTWRCPLWCAFLYPLSGVCAYSSAVLAVVAPLGSALTEFKVWLQGVRLEVMYECLRAYLKVMSFGPAEMPHPANGGKNGVFLCEPVRLHSYAFDS